MVDEQSISELSRRIAEEFHPEKIILFGSYAYGRPGPDSDVDLLVVMRFKGNSLRKAVEIRMKVDPKIPLDLVVRTPETIEQRLAWNDFFLREVIQKGKVLYDADHA